MHSDKNHPTASHAGSSRSVVGDNVDIEPAGELRGLQIDCAPRALRTLDTLGTLRMLRVLRMMLAL